MARCDAEPVIAWLLPARRGIVAVGGIAGWPIMWPWPFYYAEASVTKPPYEVVPSDGWNHRWSTGPRADKRPNDSQQRAFGGQRGACRGLASPQADGEARIPGWCGDPGSCLPGMRVPTGYEGCVPRRVSGRG